MERVISDQWTDLNAELGDLGDAVVGSLAEKCRGNTDRGVFYGFANRASSLFRAIRLLRDEDVACAAQSLCLELVELRITFDCFLLMYCRDREKAVRRVLDALILEEVKQLDAGPAAQKLV